MIRLDDLQVFVQTSQDGSFSAAARRLNLAPAFASSSVMRLERTLGIRLFIRSTRSLRLSEDGERYLPHARAALAALTSGEAVLALGRTEISGSLRLSMPSDLGRNVLLPWLDRFQQIHPKLQLHLRVSDQMADFFREALDVGLRYGMLADSSLVALPIAPANRRTLCASPAYVERHGAPRHPDELRRHNCLRYVMAEHTYERWSFHLPGGMHTVSVSGDRISDDADIVRRWALAGMGVVYKSRLDVAADLHAGRLVELFPREYGQLAPLQLVSAHRASVTPVVQQLRDFLVARCEEVLIA